jgi:replicative DNA helicase
VTEQLLIPHSREAEMAVLGAMMLNPAIAVEIATRLSGADFYQPRNELIFAAIARLLTAGEPTEPAAVAIALGADLDRVGGAGYVHDCLSAVANPLSAPYYAERIADDATRRKIITAAATAQLAATQPDTDIAAVIDTTEHAILTATRTGFRRDRPTHIAVLGHDTLDALDARIAGDATPGIPTGLTGYDSIVTHRPGQMGVIGGRPGMGKSILTQQWLLHAARTGRRALLFSTEMTAEDMILRIISDIAHIDSHKLDRGTLTPTEQHRAHTAEQAWQDWPLDIIDWCQTWPAIRSMTRRHANRHGDLAIIGIDFLQRITPTAADSRTDNRNLLVGRWADEIKNLALELGIFTLVASQLRRDHSTTAPRPTMSDLRESGQIEQAADVVTLIHRPEYYDPAKNPGTAELIIAKHRRGATDTTTVRAQLHHSRFANLPPINHHGTP